MHEHSRADKETTCPIPDPNDNEAHTTPPDPVVGEDVLVDVYGPRTVAALSRRGYTRRDEEGAYYLLDEVLDQLRLIQIERIVRGAKG